MHGYVGFALLQLLSIIPHITCAFTVSGYIKLNSDNIPAEFPENTWLIVSVQDTAMQDAPLKLISQSVVDISGYTSDETNKAFPLQYTVNVNEDPTIEILELSVSAVINVHWKREEGGKEWVRRGDYLTDTVHTIDEFHHEDQSQTYTKEILIVYYT